jgi:cell division protein FtsQ
MFPTFKWKKAAGVLLVVLTSVGLLAAVEKRTDIRTCRRVAVLIDDGKPEHQFVNASDVEALLVTDGGSLVGKRLEGLNLKALEARVRSNGLVRECQVSTDLSGTLKVRVWQHRPVARLIERGGNADADGYLNTEGDLLPLSEHYTARVLLVAGPYFERLPNLKERRHDDLRVLLHFVTTDPFWNAQIAQVVVERNGEVTLLPTVGTHEIALGVPTNVEAKFRKLKVFYTQILPARGWDAYQRVSVAFKNQVVCEESPQSANPKSAKSMNTSPPKPQNE